MVPAKNLPTSRCDVMHFRVLQDDERNAAQDAGGRAGGPHHARRLHWGQVSFFLLLTTPF